MMEGYYLLVLLVVIVLMFLFVGATVLFLLYYVGYFYKVRVTAGPSIVSELRVAYKLNTGHYSTSQTYFSEIEQIAPKIRTMAIFYDDPQKADPNSRCCIIGAILTEGLKQESDALLEKKFLESGFKVICLPKVDFSVKASHPFPIPFASSIAAAKAYPALDEYIKGEKLCAHPFMEIYDDGIIHYMVPLSKQADFYVDEVRDSMRSSQD